MAAALERRVAIEAARAAGELLHAQFRAAHRVAFKGQTTNLVTEMDVRAEELIVRRLAAAFPEDAILAEERGAARGRSGRRWIVDPLDGTTNYAHGLPIFAVSIALEVDRRIALGVAYDPSADELYVAERGQGATVNEAPLAVSATATLDASLLSTGFPYDIRETRDTNLTEYAAFALRCRGCAGSAPPSSISRGSPPGGSTASGSYGWGRGTWPRPASWWKRPAGASRIWWAPRSTWTRPRWSRATAASTTRCSPCCATCDQPAAATPPRALRRRASRRRGDGPRDRPVGPASRAA